MQGKDKHTIYQLLVRLFGNKHTKLISYGQLKENGSGKFNDINDNALKALAEMGISHIWYTGILHHSCTTDYSEYGIPTDSPVIVKGRAGSPYAIKDYYDVHPDLAESVENRMHEFQSLVQRTHYHGMKVIIDFVPNHVARSYQSLARPSQIPELGALDNTQVSFSPHNNFYYLPGEKFSPPAEYQPIADESKESVYEEFPAKVTGNDVFSATPGINDWFGTIKLNYGINYHEGRKTYFDPIPSTWLRMFEILHFWASKGVNGFRCDMAEMVPPAFWHWIILKMKSIFPDLLFIAEVYDPAQYHHYIHYGKFDYLYDKVGVYDHIIALLKQQASALDMKHALWQSEGIDKHMLRFMENHDEQRIASPHSVGHSKAGIAAMTVSAMLNRGPVMVYFGQEVGEPALGSSGFSGDDGRSTIFDYWACPEHQKWMNEGKFDGEKLSTEQQDLRAFYQKLLTLCQQYEAIRSGHFYELPAPEHQGELIKHKVYQFLRHTEEEVILVMANFSHEHRFEVPVFIPQHAWDTMQMNPWDNYDLHEILWGKETIALTGESTIVLEPWNAKILLVRKQP